MADSTCCPYVLRVSAYLTVNIYSGDRLDWKRFISEGKIAFMHLSESDLPKRTAAARFIKIPKMTGM